MKADQWWSCGRKAELTERTARRIAARNDARIYRCDYGDHWHVAKEKKRDAIGSLWEDGVNTSLGGEEPKDILLTGGPRNGYRGIKWSGDAPPVALDYRDGTYVYLYTETDGTSVYGWTTGVKPEHIHHLPSALRLMALIQDHQRGEAEGRMDHKPGSTPASCILCAVLEKEVVRQMEDVK